MKTRTASLSDLPHAAELCSKAFYDDELYSKMFPHKAQFPDDYLRGFERKFRSRMLQRNVVVFLAETEPGDVPGDLEDKGYGGMGWDSAGGQTAGVAVWMRDGHDGGRDVNPWAGVQLGLLAVPPVLLDLH